MDIEDRLFIGDCLPVMKEIAAANGACADLVYLDPPFNSNADYAFVFGRKNASRFAETAFRDTWKWTLNSRADYDAWVDNHGRGFRFLSAMHVLLGTDGAGGAMLAYLTHIVPRLAAIRELLKPGGSIYLHCDPHASHYLKLAMDSVFGEDNFRNEIVWCYAGGGVPRRDYPRKHDLIFRYAGEDRIWNPEYRPYSGKHAGFGRPAGKVPDSDMERGTPLNDWWTDIRSLGAMPSSRERLGYPTQKPLSLVERIIRASSNEGGVVLDPYCGCGTTIAAAVQTGRKFIGIDIERFAAQVIQRRILLRHKRKVRLGVSRPTSENDYRQLMVAPPHSSKYIAFQYYAVSLIPGAVQSTRASGDRGVDGWLFVHRHDEKQGERIIISVKAGEQLQPAMVRDLRGVIEREKALGGILVSLHSPTPGMREEAREAGVFTDGRRTYDRITLASISDLLAGRVQLPTDPAVDFMKLGARERELFLG